MSHFLKFCKILFTYFNSILYSLLKIFYIKNLNYLIISFQKLIYLSINEANIFNPCNIDLYLRIKNQIQQKILIKILIYLLFREII